MASCSVFRWFGSYPMHRIEAHERHIHPRLYEVYVIFLPNLFCIGMYDNAIALIAEAE
jgi:hypothetical protein